MKKLLSTLILMTCLFSTLKAQCWQSPDCTNQQTVSGTLKNTNFSGSICFDGIGTINPSVNFNNFTYLGFAGTIDIRPNINLQNGQNLYVNGNITFKNVHFNGGDTLFVNGVAVINNTTSNNSNGKHTNVIYLTEGSSVTIGNNTYTEGEIPLPGNSSNTLKILNCNTTLAVEVSQLQILNGVLVWHGGQQVGIDSYTIQGSNNARDWHNLNTIAATQRDYTYTLNGLKLAYLGGLFTLVLLGFLAPKKRLKTPILAILLCSFVLFSCNKNNNTPQPNQTYKFYRLAINYSNGVVDYSQVIKNN